VLGPTGVNFGAGMTNGVAWVLDEDGGFAGRVNDDAVALETMTVADEDAAEFRALVERHLEMTGSAVAARLLADWPATLASTWRVMPRTVLAKRAEEAAAAAEATRGVAD